MLNLIYRASVVTFRYREGDVLRIMAQSWAKEGAAQRTSEGPVTEIRSEGAAQRT